MRGRVQSRDRGSQSVELLIISSTMCPRTHCTVWSHESCLHGGEDSSLNLDIQTYVYLHTDVSAEGIKLTDNDLFMKSHKFVGFILI